MSCKYWDTMNIPIIKYGDAVGARTEERCNGTRERDIVTCGGDPMSPHCVYYKENRAKKQAEIENIIRVYKEQKQKEPFMGYHIDSVQNKDETLIMEGKCYKDNITGEIRWEWMTP